MAILHKCGHAPTSLARKRTMPHVLAGSNCGDCDREIAQLARLKSRVAAEQSAQRHQPPATITTPSTATQAIGPCNCRVREMGDDARAMYRASGGEPHAETCPEFARQIARQRQYDAVMAAQRARDGYDLDGDSY